MTAKVIPLRPSRSVTKPLWEIEAGKPFRFYSAGEHGIWTKMRHKWVAAEESDIEVTKPVDENLTKTQHHNNGPEICCIGIKAPFSIRYFTRTSRVIPCYE